MSATSITLLVNTHCLSISHGSLELELYLCTGVVSLRYTMFSCGTLQHFCVEWILVDAPVKPRVRGIERKIVELIESAVNERAALSVQ